MANTPVRRCAVYTRKSSEEGLEQDYNSLHAQREACEAFISSQAGEGWAWRHICPTSAARQQSAKQDRHEKYTSLCPHDVVLTDMVFHSTGGGLHSPSSAACFGQ
jgi:hypothetical protein